MRGLSANFFSHLCICCSLELKAVKGGKQNLPAVEIRAIAAQFAAQTVTSQQAQFATWGLLTDWTQHYRTMDPAYVQASVVDPNPK
jgi:isoleucyl-tRNA synthetase